MGEILNLIKYFNAERNPEKLACVIAFLAREHSINVSELTDSIIKNTVNLEYDEVQTITDVIVRTGLPRYKIRQILSKQGKKYQNSGSNPHKYSKTFLIRQALRAYFNKYNKKHITYEEFVGVIRSHTHGETTDKSWYEELQRLSLIKVKKKGIKLSKFNPEKSLSKINYLEFIIDTFDKVVDTSSYNKNQKPGAGRRFQRTYRSTQISPESSKDMQEDLLLLFNDFWKKTEDLYNRHESDVPIGTFDETGAFLMQFNPKKE